MHYRLSSGQSFWTVVLFLVAVGCSLPASADLIEFKNVVVDEDDIFQDSVPAGFSFTSPTGDPNSNLINFPTNFKASALANEPALDFVDGTLSLTISAVGDFYMGSILVSETGIYSLMGPGTAATQVAVGTAVYISINEVNGSWINPVVFSQEMTFTPKADGNFNLVDDPGDPLAWDGSVLLDIAAALQQAEVAGGATKVVISLDNALFASREVDSEALIRKDDLSILVNNGGGTPLVPEPSTMLLVLLGSGLLLVRRLRRS